MCCTTFDLVCTLPEYAAATSRFLSFKFGGERKVVGNHKGILTSSNLRSG